MCIFQKLTFEAYTTEPRLKPDYFQPGETPQQFRSRQFARRKGERECNREANKARGFTGQIAPKQIKKVAER